MGGRTTEVFLHDMSNDSCKLPGQKTGQLSSIRGEPVLREVKSCHRQLEIIMKTADVFAEQPGPGVNLNVDGDTFTLE